MKFKYRNVFYWLLVLFIFGIAIILRSQEWLSNNFLFLIDQGRDMMAVKSIVFDHHLTLIGPYTSLQGVFQGPLWYYLLSVPTIITKGDPIGPQFLMFLISILTVLTVYIFTKHLFGARAAIASTFLFAISPEAISAATYIWNPHPMWFLITLYVFTFYLVTIDRNKFQILLWFLIGLMFNFEAALAFFILLASLIYLLVFERKKIISKYFFIGVSIFILTFLPQILFEIRHNFLMTKSILSLFSGHNGGLFVRNEQQGYGYLILDHLKTFYNNILSGFIQFKLFPSLNSLFLLLFICVGALCNKIRIISEKEKKYLNLLFRLTLIIYILSFLYPFPIRYWFLTGFQTFYILFIGLVVSKLWSKILLRIITLLLFILICFQTFERIYAIYSSNDLGGTAKISGQKDVIDYIYKDASGKPFGLFIFTPPVSTFAYDYNLWWYARPKYNYMPYKEKKGIYYLLIDPDSGQPWSYNGWLETVIKTGNIIYTKKLPSGFIVQKRES